jgi:integrase/recombinase XerC
VIPPFGAQLPQQWLAARGGRSLQPNGIKIRLCQVGGAAGVDRVHAHRWRHSVAHQWKKAGADTGDLMPLLLGWSSAITRARGRQRRRRTRRQTQAQFRIGERIQPQ